MQKAQELEKGEWELHRENAQQDTGKKLGNCQASMQHVAL